MTTDAHDPRPDIRAALAAPFVRLELSEAMTWSDQVWHPSARIYTRETAEGRWRRISTNLIAGSSRAELLRAVADFLEVES